MSEPTVALLRCSFCGKSQVDVRKLIAGSTVYICDECINLCNDIIAECDRAEAVGRMCEAIAHAGAYVFALHYLPPDTDT